jgi:hypothetical protein
VPRLCGHPEKLAIFLSIRARSRGRAGDQGRGRGSSAVMGPLTCGPSRRPCATAEDPDPQAGGKRPPLFTAVVFTGRRSCARLFGWFGVELCRQLSAARYSLLSSSALKLPARAVVVLFVLGGHHSELAAGCFCCFGLFLGWRLLLRLLVA